MKSRMDLARMAVVAGLLCPSPSAWAALEAADSAKTTREVSEQVDRLVAEVSARDPELAQEIQHQGDQCLRDLSDGRLDDQGLTKDIQTQREVQREMTERVLTGEMARVNPEAADRMRAAFEAQQGGGAGGRGGGEFAGPSPMGLEQARGQFEQVYQEAVTRGDTKGAEMMKTAFESMERGEAVRPTPEMMERMHQEMEHYLTEHPEHAEYAHVEWDRMMEHGLDQGERSGSTGTPEQARETLERGFENGAHDMEHLREMGDAGRAEARKDFERLAESPEARSIDRDTMERYREMADRSFEVRERNTDTILDNRIVDPVSGSGGGGTEHTFVRDLDGPNSEWNGPNGIHQHLDGTAPHSQ